MKQERVIRLASPSTKRVMVQTPIRKDVEWKRGGKADVLETYLKLHEGKIGAHWLWCAIERINAGESEVEVMDDYGYAPIDPIETVK